MKVNLKKTKFMLFNACTSIDFLPSCPLEETEIELLGVVLTSDLKFDKNSKYIAKKGFKRLWMLK